MKTNKSIVKVAVGELRTSKNGALTPAPSVNWSVGTAPAIVGGRRVINEQSLSNHMSLVVPISCQFHLTHGHLHITLVTAATYHICAN